MPKLVPIWLYYVTVLLIIPATWALVYSVMKRRERRHIRQIQQLAQGNLRSPAARGSDRTFIALEDCIVEVQQRMDTYEQMQGAELRLLSQSLNTMRDTLKSEIDGMRADILDLQHRKPVEATAIQRLTGEVEQLKFKIHSLRTPAEPRRTRRAWQAPAGDQGSAQNLPDSEVDEGLTGFEQTWRTGSGTGQKTPAPADSSAIIDAIYGLDNVTQFPSGRSKPN